MTGQPIFPQRTDPDLNADAIIAGREPSASLTIAAIGPTFGESRTVCEWKDGSETIYDYNASAHLEGYAGSPSEPKGWRVEYRRVTNWSESREAARASSSYEEDYLAAERGRQEELARKVGFLEAVLAGIAEQAESGLTRGGSSHREALGEIRNAAHAALRIPTVGTRVKRLIPPRGDQGSVVGWSAELNVPLIEWDSERGLLPEACEPHEYATDLNEEIQR